MDFDKIAPVLARLHDRRGPRAGNGDLGRFAEELGTDEPTLRLGLSWGLATGLLKTDTFDDRPETARLTQAGAQYLALGGQVGPEVLNFLPKTLNDLRARRAVLSAGQAMVSSFQAALLDGGGLDYACDLLPDRLTHEVGRELALGLFAAAAAMVARLSAEEPAACVAEEIVLVNLIDEARQWLLLQTELDGLRVEEAEQAMQVLPELLVLGRDPALARVFASRNLARRIGARMDEPALDEDAYPSEVWFRPYPGVPATGHLDTAWR